MTFTHHSQVINFLIEKFGFRSYLEIGLHDARHNFDLIKCKNKVSVDPSNKYSEPTFLLTSDDFFHQNSRLTFDIVFIDGLHSAEQVKKDFENSLQCLNEGGFILIH